MKREKARTSKKQSFVLHLDSDAKDVCLAGDFSKWTPLPMKKSGANFQTSVELGTGQYHYKFIVDGQWRTDPACLESAPNGLGGANSVVHVV